MKRLIPAAMFAIIIINAFLLIQGRFARKAADRGYDQLVSETVSLKPEEVHAESKEVVSDDSANAATAATTEAATEETTEAVTEAASEEDEIDYPALDVDHQKLKEINKDYVGFLDIPVLDCKYPVVHSHDNAEYLHQDFEGNASVDGSIFMDCHTNAVLTDANSFILGHNMKSGSMFGCLRRFYQEDGLCDQDPYVYLYTQDAVRKYRIVGYMQVAIDDPIYDLSTDFSDGKTYDYFIERLRANSLYNVDASGIDFSQRPQLLTLSTCYGNGDSRFVVIAALEGVAK